MVGVNTLQLVINLITRAGKIDTAVRFIEEVDLRTAVGQRVLEARIDRQDQFVRQVEFRLHTDIGVIGRVDLPQIEARISRTDRCSKVRIEDACEVAFVVVDKIRLIHIAIGVVAAVVVQEVH